MLTTSKPLSSAPKVEDQPSKLPVSGGLETKALPSLPPTASQVISLYFSENIAAPLLPFALPQSGLSHLETTTQLAYCNNLLRAHLTSPSFLASIKASLTTSQQASVDAILQDEEEQSRVRWLTTRVVEEFAADALKTSAKISEVLLLGPYLDQEYHRKLLNVFIDEFKNATLLDVDVLQGLVQLVKWAPSDYILPDDFVKILGILRTHLQDIHKQAAKHLYHLTLALASLLDAMVEGKVKDLSRVVDQEPLAALLGGLSSNSDLHLKHQAVYALQGLLHIPNEESRRQFVLRHAGNIAMGLIGVASVCNLDVDGFSNGLGQLKDAAKSVFEVGSQVIGGAQAVYTSGQGLLDSLKGGAQSGGRKLWYPALREAQEHVRNGRLADFNRLVLKAPCRRDVEFLWGVCQLLGEIAIDLLWDIVIRQHAVGFLGELYRNDTIRDPDEDVDRWILNILRQVVALPDAAVSEHAQSLLRCLEKEGNSNKQAVYRDVLAGPINFYPLKVQLSSSSSSSLFERVKAVPAVNHDIYVLKLQRLSERVNAVYISPQAKPTHKSDDNTLFPLMEKAQEFLASHRTVLLLLGDSGAGKSTFNLQLERTLWNSYKAYGRIPLYINLPTIDDPAHDLIEKQLTYHNFSEDQIRELKLHREFVLICDGYDESQLKTNLYTTNQFNQPGQWKVKVVISCRSQYLGADYRSRFQPQSTDRYARSTPDLLLEAVIAPFSRFQIEQYVEQYVKSQSAAPITVQDRPAWTKEDYMETLITVPKLIELVSNPFLLTLSLDALPEVIDLKKENLSTIRITRVQLYDGFVKQWLGVNKARLESNPLTAADQEAFDLLVEDDFFYHGVEFQKNLAAAIFKHQKKKPVVQYTHLRDVKTWKAEFFHSSDSQIKLLRESSAITRSGNFFRFIHKSLLEYFYSRVVYDPLDYDADPNADPDTYGDAGRPLPSNNYKDRLSRGDIIEEPSVMQFLAERVDMNSLFKKQLFDALEESKTDVRASQAAANAFSILVRAGVRFNGANLRGIRAPRADLRGAQLDSANLQEADLTGVNLSKAWLRRANLSKAQVEGVQFGELPYLKVAMQVSKCEFTSDGVLLAVSTEDDTICVYATSEWEQVAEYSGRSAMAVSPTARELAWGSFGGTVEVGDILTGESRTILRGHAAVVKCISYSRDGTLIATGSEDTTIRIWSAESGETLCVLKEHQDVVHCVRFSPQGNQLLSASQDTTVRSWNVKTGEHLRIIGNHDKPMFTVAYSPDGRQLATSGDDTCIRIWDADTGDWLRTLVGHILTVFDLSYSPDSNQLASCDRDSIVRLWNVHTGECLNTLSGQRYLVSTVVYSPCGGFIASGAWDGTVRLWKAGEAAMSDAISDGQFDTALCVDISQDGKTIVTGHEDNTVQFRDILTGELKAILKGHTAKPVDVLYSPCFKWIASGDRDGAVRLWSAKTGESLQVLEGHTRTIWALAFSPDSAWIASASKDTTARVWATETGELKLLLDGHRDQVADITFSPAGDRIATCSNDCTARVWCFKTGTQLYSLQHNDDDIVTQVFYSPNGQDLFTVQYEEVIPCCWNPLTAERIPISPRFNQIGNGGITWAMSPDGRFLAGGRRDGVMGLWVSWSGTFYEVLRTFVGLVLKFRWRQTTDDDGWLCLLTLFAGALKSWKVVERGRTIELQLVSNVGANVLSLEEINLSDAVGLSPGNNGLVTQRGKAVS
ncbi:WD40 repeat-like protein [Linnemannia elongata AG-77]|uniref:WD40 repeat-like protein n=1 Tax=Linnemannia elongata AG-77 TaxID=1314771 RepID=A0A197K0C7_9FUNG|nr:WD40 repeat-like protein [Linnemannia elongata AG-77]